MANLRAISIFWIVLAFATPSALAKKAAVFIAPGVNDETWTLSKRVNKEIDDLRERGYEVWAKDGASKDDILDAILSQDVQAISYFGHGSDAKMAGLGAAGWKRKAFSVLFKRYLDDGLPQEEAFQRADAESKNFGLELVSNFSCGSLASVSLAHQFVKPLGYYYGVPKSYTTCPSFATILGDADFKLTEYRVPLPIRGGWDSNYGCLQLKQGDIRETDAGWIHDVWGRVTYNNGNTGFVEGALEGRHFDFEWHNEAARGTGALEVSLDGQAMGGTFTVRGTGDNGKWTMTRRTEDCPIPDSAAVKLLSCFEICIDNCEQQGVMCLDGRGIEPSEFCAKYRGLTVHAQGPNLIAIQACSQQAGQND